MPAARPRSEPRLRVVRGGPTAHELAAVTLAIDEALSAEASARRPPPLAAWLRAARIEGLGGHPVACPHQLR